MVTARHVIAGRLGSVGVPVVVGVIAAALGMWRVMPDVAFWDTGEFQTIPPILGTAHPTGYPTYVLLGWVASAILTPLGEPALRMNVLSAVFVGIACGVVVDLARRLTASLPVGAAAGLGLAATPIVWAVGTHADPHALHLAFVAILLWLLVRWDDARAGGEASDRWLLAAAAVTGLSIGNHSLTLLLGLPIGLFVLAVEPEIVGRRRFVAECALATLVPAALVYLELPLRGGLVPALQAPLVYGHPATLGGFAYVATGEQFRGGLNDPFGDLPGKLVALIGRAGRELGPLVLPAIGGFAVTAARYPAFALLTGTALAITCFFNAAYVNADLERYYLGPALIAWLWLAILAGWLADVGGRLIARSSRRPSDRERGVRSTSLVGGVVVAALLLAPTAVSLPARAARVDRTLDLGARPWLEAVLSQLEPDAIVVSWWSYSTPLWYAQQIEGRRTDVAVIDDRTRLDENLGDVSDVIERYLASRPVYVIRGDSLELDRLRAEFDLTRLDALLASNVFRVTRHAAGAGR
jgi:hypothetical protein